MKYFQIIKRDYTTLAPGALFQSLERQVYNVRINRNPFISLYDIITLQVFRSLTK